jgi:hypothetical protein
MLQYETRKWGFMKSLLVNTKRTIEYFIARLSWWILFRSIRWWSNHYMDQFEVFKFEGKSGTVYVNIGRATQYEDAFDECDKNGKLIRQAGL